MSRNASSSVITPETASWTRPKDRSTRRLLSVLMSRVGAASPLGSAVPCSVPTRPGRDEVGDHLLSSLDHLVVGPIGGGHARVRLGPVETP